MFKIASSGLIKPVFPLAILLIALIAAGSRYRQQQFGEQQMYILHGQTMGTTYSITVYGGMSAAALKAEIENRLQEISLRRLMKGLDPLTVIGKGDGMDNAVDCAVSGVTFRCDGLGNGVADCYDILLILRITGKDL